uniref:Integrase catalytic domain-containing protein n=1 Tax=Fagus sylvatica TaxID=28930 RepID=A0A2N9HSJ2_FAGSY
MIIKVRKDLRNLPWPPPLKDNDHHSPALRWSLLLHIMELRKQADPRYLGATTMPPKRSTRQNSVANSHAEVESQGHSHAMGETHAHGGGQTLGEENPLGGGQVHGGGQVLGGGEIPVGGPQQMALMFEMIKGMQQNQIELAESLRQLREANGNKEDHQNKNDNRNHEERESHNKNDTPFVTMSDVADLLKQERERPPKEPRHFVRRPPYPIELLKEPYPEKYDTPVFALFDGRKGSAMEHISKFLDSMGPFAAHGDLCLREFSKSLVDRAYTWYTVLPAGSIRTWEDMVESFCSKYFHVEEKITLVNLHSTKQQTGEDLVKYIHRFRDVSLDCHVKYQEGEASGVKPQVEKSRDKKSLPQTLTVSTATAPSGTKRKNPTDKAYEEPPPLPFTAEEMMAIFDKWVQDQVIKLPKISKQPTPEEQKDPKYCRYHRYVNHSTVDCRTLRWEVNRKIQNGTLLLSEEQQKVHQTPFPNHNKGKGKAVVSVVIHGNVSDMEAEEDSDLRQEMQQPKHLLPIAAESGATCFTAEAHASRAFLETTNAITFTDEDMEVQYPDHRRPLYLSVVIKDVQVRRALVDTGSCLNLIPLSTLQAVNLPHQKIQGSPMEVTGFGGVTEYTMGHVQLVLKVGPIVALTRFHVVNAETPYHVLLGRPWLHKHKLVSSTYHQCVKGRLNGKPIRIAANSSSTGEPSIMRPCGTPLPAWEDIKDDPEIDLRELLQRKKKRKEREVEQGSAPQCQEGPTPEEGGLQPSCHLIQQTENFGKVVVDQLQPTAMSSEEVMVDHARSMVMNPQVAAVDQTRSMAANTKKAAEDQIESTTTNSEGSTVDHSRSTVMNSEEEDAVDQTEPTARKRKESTTAEPNLTSKEELEVINLSDDPNVSKPISISKSLSAKERKCLIDLLHEYKDVFAWDYHEMPGIDPGLVAHSLNVEPGTRPVIQPPVMPCFPSWTDLVATTKSACPPEMLRRLPFAHQSTIFIIPSCPSGLKNAGATYQRTMTAMFHDMMHKEIEDYVDDIVVKSKKREDHLRILRKVFDRCRLYKLKMNPLKCAFGVSVGKFLGFLVHNRGIDVDSSQGICHSNHEGTNLSQRIEELSKGDCPTLGGSSLEKIAHRISHEVPGEIGEALLADLADSTWTLKFDGSSTSNSKYEAYITGLGHCPQNGNKASTGDWRLQPYNLPDQGYADALATLGSQVSFEGSKVDVTIDKRSMPITDLLREKFKEQNLDAEDWRTPIKAKLMSPEGVADLKVLKDYVLIAGDLYRRLPGGVLARCVNPPRGSKKANRGPREVLMSKEAASLQDQCSFCQHQHESDQIYATFVSSDWRTPFLEYFIENILPQTSQAAIRIKKLATRYFVEGGILFRKGFHGDPLRCLSLAESQTNMAMPWPFHTWGLDLIGPINPSSGGYIWILVATEYFSKWVEAIPLRKATGAAVANFIREHIITRFDIPHKIISDNDTPFVNKNVREVLEHYRIKHRRSTPYYPQGNGQAEATNRMLLCILSKMVFYYGKGWSSHLADTLWAYRGSTKTATGFTPFSLQEWQTWKVWKKQESWLQVRSLRYHQKLADAYEKTLQTRIFAKGQMVLKTVDHVRRGLPSPSKFAPNWEGPYLIREAYDSGYYKLSTADGTTLVDPINGKWLKRYYS